MVKALYHGLMDSILSFLVVHPEICVLESVENGTNVDI